MNVFNLCITFNCFIGLTDIPNKSFNPFFLSYKLFQQLEQSYNDFKERQKHDLKSTSRVHFDPFVERRTTSTFNTADITRTLEIRDNSTFQADSRNNEGKNNATLISCEFYFWSFSNIFPESFFPESNLVFIHLLPWQQFSCGNYQFPNGLSEAISNNFVTVVTGDERQG